MDVYSISTITLEIEGFNTELECIGCVEMLTVSDIFWTPFILFLIFW